MTRGDATGEKKDRGGPEGFARSIPLGSCVAKLHRAPTSSRPQPGVWPSGLGPSG
ncbi:hypothetical protein JK222_13725 [Gluconobacter cerinus]|uniref:hypothetical protein n=1 Tax=Gluconobacter cerinus TaxID=38307 RepID=UPI001B8CEDD4|nr:hypothetical protein [Gluconobacter cerinus]MBS1072743.1 hypothetical protein [Gluconobacter cerinus]